MYYYKAIKGTETFTKAKSWLRLSKYAQKLTMEMVNSLPFDKPAQPKVTARRDNGVITAIQLNEKPEGWKQVGKMQDMMFYPKVSNKEYIELVNSVPTYTLDDMAKIAGYHDTFFGSPGYVFGEDEIGIIYHEDKTLYTLPSDVVEITRSEYENIG